MKDTQNVTIVLLCVTAAILTTLLVTAYVNTGQTAYAGPTSRGGDYMMTTGMYDDALDFIYVIDIASEKLNMYYLDTPKATIVVGDTIDLSKAFK